MSAVERLRVALVHMPFGSTRYPSIQLGLLKAILARHGIPCTVHYLNLHFAARLGWESYESLCDPWCRLIGEWIFARAAFGDGAPAAERFLDAFRWPVAVLCDELGWNRARLLRLREQEAPAFVQACLDMVPWGQYDVVGFGSVFEQNCAAFGLARLIKQRYPGILTVFGGANFEEEMGPEYMGAVPWIDYAVVGEGDEVFPELLRRLAAASTVADMPGVASRGTQGVTFGGRAPMVEDLDALPEPDYEEFFVTASGLGLPERVAALDVEIPFESARGCWWGAKHHCTFCGYNALGMASRSKSPARVLAGLDELARRYGRSSFYAVDNIMSPRYVDEVFGRLAERGRPYSVFYELKTNLTREQLGRLADGGLRRVTAGVESVNAHILDLMRKGVNGIQNVRFLKWAQHYGIRVSWHLLVGFPGERPEDYAGQLETLRLIPHLPPPAAVIPVRLDRFSPYFARPEAWHLQRVRPHAAYACVYPTGLDPGRIAYFFEYDAPDALPGDTHATLNRHVGWWRAAWKGPRPPSLTCRREDDRLVIRDGRDPDAPPTVHVLEDRAAAIYEFCGPTHHTARRILDHLRERGLAADLESVEKDLVALTDRRLLLALDGAYLSLALPEDVERPLS